jgi:hypothetical protein
MDDPHELMDAAGWNSSLEDEQYERELMMDLEDGRVTIYRDRTNDISIKYRGGAWNDSGFDAPGYIIHCGAYWALLDFEETRIGGPFITNNSMITINSSMKLSDFVNIVKSPFPLELSDGNMGRFHDDDFHVKDIIIEADFTLIKEKLERLAKLKPFI